MKLGFLALFFLYSHIVSATLTKEERKVLFGAATERLKNSGIEGKILKKGDLFPDLMIGSKKLTDWLKDGPLVLTFYRGGWCPYCVKQLKELNSELLGISSKKINLIAVSPEQEKEVAKTKSKNDLNFLILSDANNELARKLNLVFKVEDKIVEEYKALGIDLVASQGNQKNELPVPATFVIATDKKVLYVFADADYTKRASVANIVSALSEASIK